jgi:hypothetical protein
MISRILLGTEIYGEGVKNRRNGTRNKVRKEDSGGEQIDKLANSCIGKVAEDIYTFTRKFGRENMG